MMLDLVEGVLGEFAERSVYNYRWKTDKLLKSSFLIAHLSGRSTKPIPVVDQDGRIHSSIKDAARNNGVSDQTVRNILNGKTTARVGTKYEVTKGKEFRYYE